MVVTDAPSDALVPRWSGDVDVARWAIGQGYGDRTYPFNRDGLTQFKTEFPTERSGLYLFECTNHDIYIGIAKDVAQRLPHHLKKHPDVQVFRFLPHPGGEPERRKVERQLVRDAQLAGLIVRNREHASGHVGPSTLDALITEDEQHAWLLDPIGLNALDQSPLIELDPSQLAAHDGDFRRLQEHPRYTEIVEALGVYAAQCIPLPRRTEATFWTVSCFPSSNRRRIFCVSMAALETFYIAASDETDTIGAAFFVDKRHLPTGRWGRALLAARGVMFDDDYTHKSGGAFEQCLYIDDIRHLRSGLKSKHVRAAAAAFNLDLMRKRQSAYKPSHCRQLAATALETTGP
ncbi:MULTISPECIES: hypothetical protein [Rhodococcus]|nr:MULTISPECIES: hypothetical protein [Rhodococcus]